MNEYDAFPSAEKARELSELSQKNLRKRAIDQLRVEIVQATNRGETCFVSNDKYMVKAGRVLKKYLEELGYNITFPHCFAVIVKWGEE